MSHCYNRYFIIKPIQMSIVVSPVNTFTSDTIRKEIDQEDFIICAPQFENYQKITFLFPNSTGKLSTCKTPITWKEPR